MLKIILFFSLVLLSACSSFEVKEEVKENKESPEWINKTYYFDGGYHYFVGIGEKSTSEYKSKKTAIDDAIGGVVRLAGVSMSVLEVYKLNSDENNIDYKLNKNITSSSVFDIKNVEIEDYYNKKDNGFNFVRVLIKVSQEEIEEIQEFNKKMKEPIVLRGKGRATVKIEKNAELSIFKARSIAEAYAISDLSASYNGTRVSIDNGNYIGKTEGVIENTKKDVEKCKVENGNAVCYIEVVAYKKRNGIFDKR
jgi:hypothetical protein